MEVVTFIRAPLYTAPDHDDVVARRLQGGEASSADFALVGHSTLKAGAVIPMSAGDIGKVYVCLEGELIVIGKTGERHVLRPLDSIFIAAGEVRAVHNEGEADATMIVVTPPVR